MKCMSLVETTRKILFECLILVYISLPLTHAVHMYTIVLCDNSPSHQAVHFIMASSSQYTNNIWYHCNQSSSPCPSGITDLWTQLTKYLFFNNMRSEEKKSEAVARAF